MVTSLDPPYHDRQDQQADLLFYAAEQVLSRSGRWIDDGEGGILMVDHG